MRTPLLTLLILPMRDSAASSSDYLWLLLLVLLLPPFLCTAATCFALNERPLDAKEKKKNTMVGLLPSEADQQSRAQKGTI